MLRKAEMNGQQSVLNRNVEIILQDMMELRCTIETFLVVQVRTYYVFIFQYVVVVAPFFE